VKFGFDNGYVILEIADSDNNRFGMVFYDDGRVIIQRFYQGSWKPQVNIRQADT